VYQSWHLHTDTAPYCQTWTETNTYFHPAETSEQWRKKLKLPRSARVGPFYYQNPGGAGEYQLCPHRVEGESHDARNDSDAL
jgi:hypothetical protein